MTADQLQALCDYLAGPDACNTREEDGKTVYTCAGTFAFTRRWLSAQGLPLGKELDFLHEKGAFCDCEVGLNLSRDAQPSP